jgi:RimJ/RimL family protein N-acetyltransferase
MSVLEKAGFIAEAILKKAFVKNGVVGDIFQYVMIKGEE